MRLPCIFTYMKRGDFIIRDLRSKEKYVVDDQYLNGYARHCGIYATGVYNVLCRHADYHTQISFPSTETIAEKLNISQRTVNRALNILEGYNIIRRERVRSSDTARWKNNSYSLVDKSQWHPCAPQSHGSHATLTTEPCDSHDKSHAPHSRTKVTHTKVTHIRKHTSENKFSRVFSGEQEYHVEDSAGTRKRADVTYRAVFALWGAKYPLNWRQNTTEIQAAKNLLEEHGIDAAREMLIYAQKNKDRVYFPKIRKPSDLDRKWPELQEKKQKPAFMSFGTKKV